MAVPAHPGPPGLGITTLTQYLNDRKWHFFEKGMMTVWNELYLLSQNSQDPTLSIISPVKGRYSWKSSTAIKQPPTNSRAGAPGLSSGDG